MHSPLTRRKLELPFGKQREIAEKLGVSQTVVSRIVNNRAPEPSTDAGRRTQRRVQVAIARALGTTVDDVFGRRESAA